MMNSRSSSALQVVTLLISFDVRGPESSEGHLPKIIAEVPSATLGTGASLRMTDLWGSSKKHPVSGYIEYMEGS
jgi:hypothetical protein